MSKEEILSKREELLARRETLKARRLLDERHQSIEDVTTPLAESGVSFLK